MAKVDGIISSLVQGVSQQPAKIRLTGQAELQENLSSDPVDGLKKRPPIDFVKELYAFSAGTQFLDFSVDGEDFIMATKASSLRIFDTTGTERTVTFDTGTLNYFDGETFIVSSADDVTYALNTAKVVATKTDTKTYTDAGHGLVFLLGGQYGRDYKIRIQWGANDETVTYSTPDGSVSTHIQDIATDSIAADLKTALEANGTINAAFTIAIESDVLHIKNDALDDIEITVSDGDGGANIFAVNHEVGDVSKLPRYAPQGYITRVTGSAASGADDWFLEFVADDDTITVGNGFGLAGKWVETVGPDTEYLMDTATLPHVLVKDVSGDFNVEFGDWKGRQVGDEISNENPSFVGKVINDIGSFQGRLVFLAGQRVIMSRTNNHTDFWIQSATTSVDSDPIDIESTAKGVSTNMLRMIPHNRDLVIFSEDAQFIVFGRNSITPKNSSLVLTTEFEANLDASPVSAGKNIYFAIDYGEHTGIREFFTEGSSDIDNSETITQHVSRYMPGKVDKMAGTSNFNLFLVQTVSDATKLYAYEYLHKSGKLIQSSWSTWVFPSDIEHMFFVGSIVYIVMTRNSKYVLCTLDLNIEEDTGLTYQTKLDLKGTAVATTTFTNPLDGLVDVDDLIIIQGSGCPNPGLTATVSSYAGATVTLKDDMGGGTVYVGIKYACRYRPTRPFVKDRNDKAINVANFKIREYRINYKNLGHIECRRISQFRDDSVLKYIGLNVGDPTTPLGVASVKSGSFRFPFGEDPEYAELELFSDSHLPMNILDIDWVGQYNKSSTRIGG